MKNAQWKAAGMLVAAVWAAAPAVMAFINPDPAERPKEEYAREWVRQTTTELTPEERARKREVAAKERREAVAAALTLPPVVRNRHGSNAPGAAGAAAETEMVESSLAGRLTPAVVLLVCGALLMHLAWRRRRRAEAGTKTE